MATSAFRAARAKATAVEEPAAATEAPATSSAPVANFYCLESVHATELVSEERFFYWEVPTKLQRLADGTEVNVPIDAAPVCEKCVDRFGKLRQVSAIPVDEVGGKPQIPQSILKLAERL